MLLYFSGQTFSRGWQSGLLSASPRDSQKLLPHRRPGRREQAGLLRPGWGRAAGPARSLVQLDTVARRISDCFMQAGVMEEERKYANGETFQLIIIIRLLQRDLK